MFQKICLASENWSSTHPLILESIINANEGFAPSYGSDLWTAEAEALIQKTFKKDCQVFIVPNGTGANVLALKLACKRHESIICTDIAHILYQESGAAESVVGCKLLSVSHCQGKITVEAVEKKIKTERAFGKHSTSPKVLSITQPTEIGTIYTLEELKNLSQLCKQENLILHIDGSRLYNAAVSLNKDLDEILDAANADLLSLGGTKNGLMGVESLLIFNPNLYEGSHHIHKQSLQLLSKQRYLSAQYIPFFKNKLWHSLAKEANTCAQEIASLIQTIPELILSYPVETNQIFFTAPPFWIPLLEEKIYCYLWNKDKNQIRFITSWNTSKEEINKLQLTLTEISHQFKLCEII